MSCVEQQQDELEALKSIYEGDECFNVVNDTTCQYKIGEDQTSKSMVLEIKWGPNYPDELPEINLDAFYNKHLLSEVKDSVIEKLKEEGDSFIGMAMTFTLFEHAKENVTDLLSSQPEILQNQEEARTVAVQQDKKVKEKKEQLTKAQKRKITERVDLKGERPRGWDWVDVVRHLSQTGGGQLKQQQQQQQKAS